MNNVNKTLYIPLYGKAYVSQKNIILRDPKAELIWKKEGFPLKGKSRSKWLAYYMGMRSAVFDNWLKEEMTKDAEAIILHIGCGMDSRIDRVGTKGHQWYDVDFPEVIAERRKYYEETEFYHMTESDARAKEWICCLPKKSAIVVLEGVSMYLKLPELQQLLAAMNQHFSSVKILLDCYTELSARVSKYKNPINDVGVTMVYGLDDPKILENGTGLTLVKEHKMTPEHLIDELDGAESFIFGHVFGGKLAKRMYRMFEFKS